MIRCPTCGRRFATPRPSVPRTGRRRPRRRPARRRRRRSWCPARPAGVPRRARRWGRAASARCSSPSARRTDSRSPSRSRAPTTPRPARPAARGGRAGRGRRPPRPGRVRARRAGRRLGVRGAWSSSRRRCSPNGWRRSTGRWRSRSSRATRSRSSASIEVGPRPRPRALRSQARERVHRRELRREAVRFRPGAQASAPADARRGDQGGGARGDARVHVARAVRGAHGHRRAQRHLRAGRDVLRDAGGRAAVLGQLRGGPAEPPQPAAARAVAPRAGRRRARGGDHALPRQGSGAALRQRHRASPGAAGGPGRGARAPGRDRGAAGGGRAPAPRRQTRAKRWRQSRPRPRASGARWRCCSSRARATSRAIREAVQRRRRAARAHGGRAVRAGVRARGRRQPDARRRHRRRDVHRPRPGEARCWSTWRRCRCRRAPTARAATRARCSARRSSIRARPIRRACCCRRAAVEVLPDAPSEEVAEPARGHARCRRRRRRRSGRRRAWASRRWSAATSCCARCSIGARRGRGSAGPTITTLLGEPGYGKTHLAQMLVQHLEVLPRMQTIFVRAKEVLGGVRRADDARAAAAHAGAARRGARGSRARAAGGAAGRRDERQEVWAGVAVAMGVGAARAPGAAVAGGGAGRAALGGGARARRGAAPMARAQAAGAGRRGRALRRRDRAGRARVRHAGRGGLPDLGVRRRAAGVRPRPHRLGEPRGDSSQELTLPPLEPAAAVELARRLLSPAENVPQSALARLAERTLGVPMLLVELVRGLKRDGLVRKSEKGQGWYLATDELERLPDLPLVQWLSSRETESLPPDLLAHARLASVLGVEFSSEEIEGVLQELERSGGAGRDAARRRHRRAAADRERHPRAAPRRARRLPPRAAARHRLPVGAAAAARGDPPRRLRLLPPARSAARDGAAAADGVSRRAQRAQGGGGAAVPGSRGAHGGAPRLPGRRAAVQERARELARAERRRADRGGAGARPDAVSPGPSRRRAQGFRGGDRAGAAGRTAWRRSSAMLLDEGIVLDWTGDWPRSRVASRGGGRARRRARGAAHAAGPRPAVDGAGAQPDARGEGPRGDARCCARPSRPAEPLGDEGYEPYTQSLSMVGYAARHPGTASTRPRRRWTACLEVYEEHGDMVGHRRRAAEPRADVVPDQPDRSGAQPTTSASSRSRANTAIVDVGVDGRCAIWARSTS